MSESDEVGTCTSCAACGKGGEGLKKCTACKGMVSYCNRDCQIAHRPKHKKACKRRAAELFDEKLFQQPPPRGDCPVCFLPMPWEKNAREYHPCCGKELCFGCINAHRESRGPETCCPFCRVPVVKSVEESIERMEARTKVNDALAFYTLGVMYDEGHRLLQRDSVKAMKLLFQAAELGSTDAHNNIGRAYLYGDGLEKDENKAIHHFQIAAMGGCVLARDNLGIAENERGNAKRAVKHWMIAASGGNDESLDTVRQAFMAGHVAKSDYEKTLRAHKQSVDEMKSDQRDEAAKILAYWKRNSEEYHTED